MMERAIKGVLRVSPRNPLYFEDSNTGEIVYLTGSHTWNNFQDMGADINGDGKPEFIRGIGLNRPGVFDFEGCLAFMVRNGHNFMRLWMWEHSRWNPWSGEENFWIYPLPFRRSGPGTANDGLPKFDLCQFDDVFFERLKDRVELALEKGIYVGIMLFAGASIGNRGWPAGGRNPWIHHPFHRNNNVNGIDGDPDGEGRGWKTHQMHDPGIWEIQRAYIRKVIDTVNAFDNVLFEVSNEDPFNSYPWHYEVIRSVQAYEAGKPKQHPVGMTIAWQMDNERLYESPADWISPAEWDKELDKDPITYDGNGGHPAGPKVMIADTDHIFFGPTTLDFTWKAFCRGQHVISMEHTGEDDRPMTFNCFQTSPADWFQTDVKRFADRMDLVRCKPHNRLSSTGFCLCSPGEEYLVFQPEDGRFRIDLSDATGIALQVEWFDPQNRECRMGTTIAGGGNVELMPPFSGPAVLYLRYLDDSRGSMPCL